MVSLSQVALVCLSRQKASVSDSKIIATVLKTQYPVSFLCLSYKTPAEMYTDYLLGFSNDIGQQTGT